MFILSVNYFSHPSKIDSYTHYVRLYRGKIPYLGKKGFPLAMASQFKV
jgi:hypothetical protein